MRLMLLPIQRKTRTWLLSMWNPFYCSDAHVVRSVYSALVCAREKRGAPSCCARSPKHWKKIRGNLPSEKSYPGSLYLYWQSLLSSGVRSPRNSIDSVQRKGSCPHSQESASPILIQKYAQQTKVFMVLLVWLFISIGKTSQEGSTKEGSFGIGSEPLLGLVVGSEYPIVDCQRFLLYFTFLCFVGMTTGLARRRPFWWYTLWSPIIHWELYTQIFRPD